MAQYSLARLLRNALHGHEHWPQVWRTPDPKAAYEVVLIGGGTHGLGAAYYLAREHGFKRIAVLEKSWIGSGNTARNTMTIRDNYLHAPSVRLHRDSMKLWRTLGRELNFNIMLHERGMITFLQSEAQVAHARRMAATMGLFGSPYLLLDKHELRRRVPGYCDSARMPIEAAIYHPRVAMARHDAVAWGYARAADALGVDIIQQCEVTGIVRQGSRVVAVETTRGLIRADKVGMAVAGHGSVVAQMAGVKLPVETWPLQAFVSTPLKPVLKEIFVVGGYFNYFMQSDKGELVAGGVSDPYPSYAQRGTPAIVEDVVAGMLDVFPAFARVRLMRQWAGMLDITYDNSPIISNTPVEGFTIDVAGSGGWKTTPIAARMHAALIATGRPDPLIAPFGLERFARGRLIREGGVDASR